MWSGLVAALGYWDLPSPRAAFHGSRYDSCVGKHSTYRTDEDAGHTEVHGAEQ